MDSEDTLLGNDLVLQLGDENSPPNYEDMCSITDPGNLGEEKPLVDVTAQCDTARAYRNGLADGAELTLTANFLSGDPHAAIMYAAYDNDTVLPFRLMVRDASPPESFDFRAIVRSWGVATPTGEKASRTFGLKVTGGVLKPVVTP